MRFSPLQRYGYSSNQENSANEKNQYEMENGTILGDPMNIQLTKDIMELGWNPPEPRTRWDLLPLVTMAEDDLPVFVEIPPSLRKLVSIGHPEYCIEFQKLGLKWVAFPALTRLGFDIGGVQYTATPFIGWYVCSCIAPSILR